MRDFPTWIFALIVIVFGAIVLGAMYLLNGINLTTPTVQRTPLQQVGDALVDKGLSYLGDI